MEQQSQVPEQSGSQAVRILRQRMKDGTARDLWEDWKWIFSFTRGRWASVLLYTVLGIATSSMTLVTGILAKYLIDCIVSIDRQRLVPLAAAMVISGIVSVGLRSVTARMSARLGVDMRNDVQKKVFDSLMTSRWLQVRQFSTGDLLNRFSADVGTVASCAVSWLPNVLIQIFTVLATLGVVLYYDPVMALIAFASTPVLIFASRRLLRRQRGFQQKLRNAGSGMSVFESEVFRNIDTLKSFGVETDMSHRLRQLQENYRAITLEYTEFSIKTNIVLTVMGTAVQYLALVYCLWRLWSGEILFGTMILFLQQRSSLSSALSALISQIPAALSGSVAAERIRELTSLDKEEISRQEKVKPDGNCHLVISGISAAYEDGRQVLKDVSIQASAGEIVALVGSSGEGKSTLIRLMLGLMQPQSGEGYLEDESGVRYPLGPEIRHLFAYVPQGNTMLAGSIAENLQLVNHQVTQEQMIQALKDACAWDFVSRLPRGIHSSVGEGGKGFSEGQAQRLAIARALVRRAPVMLLDEVTSALDYETERQVLDNILRRGVTCIVATHRPSVLRLCARVYRVGDGTLRQLENREIQELWGNGFGD